MLDMQLTDVIVAPEEFEFFRRMIYERAGISMSDAKGSLIQSRLRSRLRTLGLNDFKEYRKYLEQLDPSHEEWQDFVNCLTTNKTEWFREPEHFDYLENVFLPQWRSLKKKHLSVWCAVSSTGQEAYSISMVLRKALSGTDITYEILASDIDTNVLDRARNGVYPRSDLEMIPEPFVHDSFAFGKAEISDWMKVRKELKSPITFEQVNLVEGPYPWEERFDLIFCRNVLIYFAPQTVAAVAKNLYGAAAENSTLLIAHSESLQHSKHMWSYVQPSIYVKGGLFAHGIRKKGR